MKDLYPRLIEAIKTKTMKKYYLYILQAVIFVLAIIIARATVEPKVEIERVYEDLSRGPDISIITTDLIEKYPFLKEEIDSILASYGYMSEEKI